MDLIHANIHAAWLRCDVDTVDDEENGIYKHDIPWREALELVLQSQEPTANKVRAICEAKSIYDIGSLVLWHRLGHVFWSDLAFAEAWISKGLYWDAQLCNHLYVQLSVACGEHWDATYLHEESIKTVEALRLYLRCVPGAEVLRYFVPILMANYAEFADLIAAIARNPHSRFFWRALARYDYFDFLEEADPIAAAQEAYLGAKESGNRAMVAAIRARFPAAIGVLKLSLWEIEDLDELQRLGGAAFDWTYICGEVMRCGRAKMALYHSWWPQKSAIYFNTAGLGVDDFRDIVETQMIRSTDVAYQGSTSDNECFLRYVVHEWIDEYSWRGPPQTVYQMGPSNSTKQRFWYQWCIAPAFRSQVWRAAMEYDLRDSAAAKTSVGRFLSIAKRLTSKLQHHLSCCVVRSLIPRRAVGREPQRWLIKLLHDDYFFVQKSSSSRAMLKPPRRSWQAGGSASLRRGS